MDLGREGDILALLPLCACAGLGSNWAVATLTVECGRCLVLSPRRASLVIATGLDHVRLGALETPIPCPTPCHPYSSEQTGQPVGNPPMLLEDNVVLYYVTFS